MYRQLSEPQVRLGGRSVLDVIAYVLIAACLVLLYFPSRAGINAIIVIVPIAALSLILGTKKRLGEVELAILGIIIAQSAAARWSIVQDDASAARAIAIEKRDEQRRERDSQQIQARDLLERAARDSARVYALKEALASDSTALAYDVDVLRQELGFLKGDMIGLASTQSMTTQWWPLILQEIPQSLAKSPETLNQLRNLAERGALVQEHLSSRALFLSQQSNLRVAGAGERDRYLIHLEKLDRNLLLLCDQTRAEIRRVLGLPPLMSP